MDVLGIDQSLTMSGLARISGDLVVTDRIGTVPTGKGLTDTRQRIRYIVARTLKFAPIESLTVIEAPITPSHNAGAVLERAWLFGLLVDQLLMRGPVVQVWPSTRAMYATGNGSSKKPEVLAAMRAQFPFVVIADDNAADALALACMGARYLGSPIDGPITKKRQQAMTSTVWPDLNWSK